MYLKSKDPHRDEVEAREMLDKLVVNDTPYAPPHKTVVEKVAYPRDAAAIIQQLERDNEALFELLLRCVGPDALCQYCRHCDICRESCKEERDSRNVFWSCINGCNFCIDPGTFGEKKHN